MIRIYVEGWVEIIRDDTMSKKRLAAKPVKYALKDSQRHMSIGYNLEADHLTMRYQGVDADKLPRPQQCLEICRNKIVDSSTAD